MQEGVQPFAVVGGDGRQPQHFILMMAVGTPGLPGWMKGVEIPELKTAECTVVKGKPNQAKQPPERVQTHRIDVIPFPQPAEFIIVALRAISVPLEKSKKSAIVIAVGPAMGAVKSSAAKDAAEYASAFAFVHFAACDTTCIDSSEKQADIR